jgi:hypothetical protein
VTDIEIVNSALVNLGCNPITVIDDTTSEGRVVGRIYPVTRDALLTLREWTFAKARLQLTQDAQAPAFGYLYQYMLPNNGLAVIRAYEPDGENLIMDWVREGPYVITDTVGPIFAELIMRVSENGFHPAFVKALVAQLCADMAIPLTENRSLADSWETKAAARLVEAAVADGKQGINQVRVPQVMRGRRR